MNVLNLSAGLLAALLGLYLFFALLFPEKMS